MGLARIFALTLVVGLTSGLQPPPAHSQWSNGSYTFRSDIQSQQRAREATRKKKYKSGHIRYPKYMKGGAKPDIKPEKPDIVYLDRDEKPGTIIVSTNGRKLFYVLPGKRAYYYPISVGRQGFTWTGTERISRIKSWPSWTPPADMRRRQPGLPITVSGGLINPLGAKALYLGNSIYRIHGTNNKRSIGRASSSGCFRMLNKHVTHLAGLAKIGTTVRVVKDYKAYSESMPLSAFFSGFSSSGPEEPTKSNKRKKN